MSEKVKKLRVKQKDGTMSDYIPIGSEAKYVDTENGSTVEVELSKKPYYFNSIAAMKAAEYLKEGDCAITLGYYKPNDGGAGDYTIVSGEHTDDGGSYHLLNNGLYSQLIIKNGEINIKQFGAKGDGITDDRIPLQRIFKTDYNIFINKGIYMIYPDSNEPTKTITNIKSNKIIRGEGKESVIKASAGYPQGGTIFGISYHENIVCEVFAISGNIEENPIGNKYNDRDGIHLFDLGKSNTITLNRMYFIDNAYAGIRFLSSCKDITIKNCYFLQVDCGIITLGDSTAEFSNFIIKNNYINGHEWSEPISFFSAGYQHDILIDGNIIENKEKASGICIGRQGQEEQKNERIIITNNHITNTSGGIVIINGIDCVINNNSLYNILNGITLSKTCLRNIISNNILSNLQSGILLSDLSSYNKIYNNQINDFNIREKEGVLTANQAVIVKGKFNTINNNIFMKNNNKDSMVNYISVSGKNNILKNNKYLYNNQEQLSKRRIIILNDKNITDNIIIEENVSVYDYIEQSQTTEKYTINNIQNEVIISTPSFVQAKEGVETDSVNLNMGYMRGIKEIFLYNYTKLSDAKLVNISYENNNFNRIVYCITPRHPITIATNGNIKFADGTSNLVINPTDKYVLFFTLIDNTWLITNYAKI